MTSAGTILPAESSVCLGAKLSHGNGLSIAKTALLQCHYRGKCSPCRCRRRSRCRCRIQRWRPHRERPWLRLCRCREPGPVGKSNDPAGAMFTGWALLSRAGTPLGSPKPPVCTFFGASAMVGTAELPVENTWVFTSCFGITGAMGGSGTGLVAAISTLGATGTSSAQSSAALRAPGRAALQPAAFPSSCATRGGGISRTGAGS